MPRPKGAGSPRLGRALERIIDDIERDCSDEDIARLTNKIKRLTYRSLHKALKPGGCVQVGPVVPPEGLIGVQTAATAAKAIETLQAMKLRRAESALRIAAVVDAMGERDSGDGSRAPVEVVVRYAAGVEPITDADSTEPPAEPGTPGSATRQ